ncbi:copper resistance protein CopC [Idiomarina sp. PL1-037]|uniref:copper resistance CopC family protein n=1 Tax=Idiomarina sp. PL1-037 TaxID=3095365 RepID=UPI002ACBFA92|nr:copper resistance protein CopC [Idiomarina sp. PL1-037]WQC53653.1 copper resistance protein CopC [Idiomarina sp. PL1-037]
MRNLFKLAFATALFFSAWANAHVGMTSSSPEDGATLSESPAEITMNFSGDVRLAKIMLHSDDGKMDFPAFTRQSVDSESTPFQS